MWPSTAKRVTVQETAKGHRAQGGTGLKAEAHRCAHQRSQQGGPKGHSQPAAVDERRCVPRLHATNEAAAMGSQMVLVSRMQGNNKSRLHPQQRASGA